ncbi:N-acetyltransferase [Vibrio nigripulchritudo]|nr:N-acetyltransferase [Vibrio nigripulchritudo]BDU30951.1 N-acetyltransferase [Vibrio nigripulchritudo]
MYILTKSTDPKHTLYFHKLMSTYRIRAAQVEDLEALNKFMYQLHDYHHRETPDLFKSPEEVEQEKSISRYIDDPECFVYVAEDDEQSLVGFVSGHFCELQSSIMKPVTMGSIDEIFVTPEHRKTGVAQMLFERLETAFKECGVKQMFVEVWHFNEAALNFYNKLGLNHHIHWMRKPLI